MPELVGVVDRAFGFDQLDLDRDAGMPADLDEELSAAGWLRAGSRVPGARVLPGGEKFLLRVSHVENVANVHLRADDQRMGSDVADGAAKLCSYSRDLKQCQGLRPMGLNDIASLPPQLCSEHDHASTHQILVMRGRSSSLAARVA